jgi:hypothetical protein
MVLLVMMITNLPLPALLLRDPAAPGLLALPPRPLPLRLLPLLALCRIDNKRTPLAISTVDQVTKVVPYWRRWPQRESNALRIRKRRKL